MNRRSAHAVVAAAALLTVCTGPGLGCGDGSGATTASLPPRVNAVTAAAGASSSSSSLDAFCDVRSPAATAKSLIMPALDLPVPPAPPAPTWRWLNVWATWCKPCVEEIPLLGRWRERLAGEALPIELLFLSVDERAEDVDGWRKEHPATPVSSRVRDAAAMSAFTASLGLDAAAPIPIHVFVDPAGKVRCVRAGAVSDSDYDAVKRLLSGA